MKYSEVAKMTKSELYEALIQQKKMLLSYKINKKLGQQADSSAIRKTRKNIARLIMVWEQIKKGVENAA